MAKKVYQNDHLDVAKAFKVLANPKRINLLLALRIEACRVGNMQECINEPFPIISQQLAILRKKDIVSKTKNKKNEAYYTIDDKFTNKLLDLIIKHDKEIEAGKKKKKKK